MSVARKSQRLFITGLVATAGGLVMIGAGLQPDTKPKAPATPAAPAAPAKPDLKPATLPVKPDVKPDAPAAKEPLPTIDQIMDKSIEATGGKANWAKVKTQTTKATMTAPAMGLKGTMSTWRGENGKTFSEIDMENYGKVQQGSDGETVWVIDPNQGPRILDGEERNMQLSMARLDNPIDWKKLFKTTDVAGTEKIDDKTAYKVVCTLAAGDQTLTQFYDKESGLLVKMSITEKSPQGEIPIDIFPSDYKEVSGVKLAHKTVRKIMKTFELTETIEKIEINGEIPKDKFDLPKEITELKAAAKPAAPAPEKAPTPPAPATPPPAPKPEKK